MAKWLQSNEKLGAESRLSRQQDGPGMAASYTRSSLPKHKSYVLVVQNQGHPEYRGRRTAIAVSTSHTALLDCPIHALLVPLLACCWLRLLSSSPSATVVAATFAPPAPLSLPTAGEKDERGVICIPHPPASRKGAY